MRARRFPIPALFPWEKATHVAAASAPGLIAARLATPFTFLFFAVLAALLYPTLGLPAVVTALVFARLIALDLATYTLPNVYTLPMLAVGLAYAAMRGQALAALIAAALVFAGAWLATRFIRNAGVGGGDLKLLAALFAFHPPTPALAALAIGCILFLPVAFLAPKKPIPFGVPVLIGWALILAFPALPNWVFSSIS